MAHDIRRAFLDHAGAFVPLPAIAAASFVSDTVLARIFFEEDHVLFLTVMTIMIRLSRWQVGVVLVDGAVDGVEGGGEGRVGPPLAVAGELHHV